MYVKVLIAEGKENIEPTIQRWLNANLKIKIEGMAQSAAVGRDDAVWTYIITIIYTIN
jgi:hypothetical protein